MKMSFSNEHGPWDSNNAPTACIKNKRKVTTSRREKQPNKIQKKKQAADYPNYPNEIPYGGLWDPHHCLSGQNPALSGYPDILTAFNSELVWPRQQCGALVTNRLNRSGPQNGPVGPQKKPRRRVATMAQRRAANIRERRRMFNLNEAFDKLRRKVPTFAYEKRLSRIETLRLAITYISFMTELLHGHSPDHKNSEVYAPREYIPYGLIN